MPSDHDEAEVTAIRPLAPGLPPAGEIAQRVQGRYVTAVAVQKPRSLQAAMRRLEEEANLCGESFYYGWGAGQGRVEGPSVKLANAAARCYGNCSVEMLPVQETADAWIFTAAFIDYETGFTIERQFRMDKSYTVHGKHDEFRKRDMRFQIGQSKAVRNVILNGVPEVLVARALEVARGGARAKLEAYIAGIDKKDGKGKGIVQAVDIVLKGLAKHGAKEEAVLRKLEIADKKAIDLDRLLILRGDLAALDNGETRHDELYPPSKAEGLAGKLAAATGKGEKDKEGAEAEKDADGNRIFPEGGGSLFGGGEQPPKK